MKRTAYLAPELPSLSATFVFNEILVLKRLGLEIHTYSVHQPAHKAHGKQAEEMANQTTVIYDQHILSALKAFLVNMFTHRRSSLKSIVQVIGDVFKTGCFTKTSAKLIYQFLRGAWLAQDLRKKNVEHLHIHFAHVPTQIGMYAAALSGIPFSFTAHANDIFERPLLIKEKIKRAKKAVSISSFNIDLMRQKGGDPGKIEIVRCGVDSSLALRNTNRTENTGIFKIGSLGRLVEKKGIDTLIEAGRLLKKNGINFIIEIAGGGPLQNALENQVKENALDKYVHFLGSIPHTKVMDWMQSLDIFVLASRKDKNGDMDGIPVVLMEAMNLGIPVISTLISGIPELVRHQESGLLSEPGDAAALADHLIRLHNDPLLRDKLVKGAKKRISEEFDQERNARLLLRMFNE